MKFGGNGLGPAHKMLGRLDAVECAVDFNAAQLFADVLGSRFCGGSLGQCAPRRMSVLAVSMLCRSLGGGGGAQLGFQVGCGLGVSAVAAVNEVHMLILRG